ncbi:MerR family transcriptional regulator [Amycolatopsis minnesotensis]|uniref:MerR family transcriptional regulator n=1 Tax=Amycolatopsis minnesotensis TaxID=337894 RepID=UPI0031E13AF7
MLTIGQLARYVGVSTKTIRVYHDKGLLAEPERDASGYRRYGAGQAIELIKIRTLAEAGVPLARIRGLGSAADAEFRQALHQLDTDLSRRIHGLRATRKRLRQLADGHLPTLPAEVESHSDDVCALILVRWVAEARSRPGAWSVKVAFGESDAAISSLTAGGMVMLMP